MISFLNLKIIPDLVDKKFLKKFVTCTKFICWEINSRELIKIIQELLIKDFLN